jgi:hypothetical protein
VDDILEDIALRTVTDGKGILKFKDISMKLPLYECLRVSVLNEYTNQDVSSKQNSSQASFC